MSRRPICDLVAGLQLTTFGDLFQWVPGTSAMDRWRTQIGAKCKSELARFSTVSLVIWIESSYCNASFRLFLSLWWDELEAGEDSNWKKVLGAANASRENKSRPVSYFVHRTGNISSGIMNFLCRCMSLITETLAEKKYPAIPSQLATEISCMQIQSKYRVRYLFLGPPRGLRHTQHPQISAGDVHIKSFHRRQPLTCLRSWTQLNSPGKSAVNAWDRLCRR